MLNNFIYAQTKNLFLEQLNAGNILDEAIVFIEDTKEIWNHGHYFGGTSGSGIDPEVLSGIENAIATLQSDKADKSELADYAKKNELPSLDGYLTKTVADGLYATIAQYNALNQTVGNIQTELSNKLTSADLEGYAKTADVPTKISDLTDDSDFITNTEATAAYAPKSLVETVSNQATTISTLATKDALSTGLAEKLDNSAASGFVPTTRTVNGVALDQDITITATDPNAATKTELNSLSANLTNNYVTNGALSTELNKKQDVIDDLATIRSGAVAGATALQEADLDEINESISGIETALSNKAESSVLSNYATTEALTNGLSGKQVTLVSGTNIKTIEGQSILGSGDIQITAAQVGAYTTGEIDTKVTTINNAINAKADPSSVTAVSDRVSTLENYFSTTEDSDTTINKWTEIVDFLDGVAEGSDVEKLLAEKANSSTVSALETRVTNLTSTVDTKVDKVSGKGLSTNDFTTALKTKLEALPTTFAPTNAEANVQADWNVTDSTSDAFIKNKPTIPTIPSVSGGASAYTHKHSISFGSTEAKDKTTTDDRKVTVASSGHTHSVSGTTSGASAYSHSHGASGSFSGNSNTTSAPADASTTNDKKTAVASSGHTHSVSTTSGKASAYTHNHGASGSFSGNSNTTSAPADASTTNDKKVAVGSSGHTHSFSGATTSSSGKSHSHSFTPAGSVSSSFSGTAGTTGNNSASTSVATAAHTHSVSGTVDNGGASHTHTVNGTTASGGASHTHTYDKLEISWDAGAGIMFFDYTSTASGSTTASHTHTMNFASGATTATHRHTFSSGSAAATADNTTNRVSVAAHTHTHSFTPAGSVSSSFSGTAGTTGSTGTDHTHTVGATTGGPSATTDVASTAHKHTVTPTGSVSVTVNNGGVDHTHSVSTTSGAPSATTDVASTAHKHTVTPSGTVSVTVNNGGVDHTHTWSDTSDGPSATTEVASLSHAHTISGNTGDGGVDHTHTISSK